MNIEMPLLTWSQGIGVTEGGRAHESKDMDLITRPLIFDNVMMAVEQFFVF